MALSAVLSVMPFVCGYWPVRKLARLGEQSGVVAKALVKRAPSAASRFMCGVSMKGWPAAPKSSQRMSSTSTNTMFGRRGAAVVAGVSAGPLHDSGPSAANSTSRRRSLIGASSRERSAARNIAYEPEAGVVQA